MKTEQKYYIGNYNKITIRCLACKKVRTLEVDDLRFRQHLIQAVCPCSYSFTINLEFRKSYRKQLNIAGMYRKIHNPVELEKPCVVKNISFGGLGLTITNESTIQVDDELIVAFKMGALLQHKFEAVFKVRYIDSSMNVGGMFTEATPCNSTEIITILLR